MHPPNPAKGRLAFEAYYQGLFHSPQTFLKFLQALAQKYMPVLYVPPHSEVKLRALWHKAGLLYQPLSWFPQAIIWPKTIPFGQELPGYRDHWLYPLSPASLLPLLALSLRSDESLIDVCAAPGGKSLIALGIAANQAQILANDLSPHRTQRLKRMLEDYGYHDCLISSEIGEKLWLKYPEVFDKVLVDAPCSSEAHTYNSPAHLAVWSRKRITGLKHRQINLVLSAFKTLKVGGRLVYSTCAVTPEENEAVVAAVIKLIGSAVSLTRVAWGEAPGSHGLSGSWEKVFNVRSVRRILPHLHHLPPMFVAAFHKNHSLL